MAEMERSLGSTERKAFHRENKRVRGRHKKRSFSGVSGGFRKGTRTAVQSEKTAHLPLPCPVGRTGVGEGGGGKIEVSY